MAEKEKSVLEKIKARRKAEADALKALDSAQAQMPSAQEQGVDYDASLHKGKITYEESMKAANDIIKRMKENKKHLEEDSIEWDPTTKTWKKSKS